jgi:hypothetical protein
VSVLVCGVDECRLDPGHDGAHVVWAGFKYATPRDLSRKTGGGRVAKIAAAIDRPGMPWQCEVWDVALERDAFGRLVYEIVIVTVPRQSGKTTLYGPVQIDRCIMMPGIKTFYTAQTGKDARSRFNDWIKLLVASPLDAIARYRFSAGDEGILFPNGSALKIFAPVVGALHGETPPLVGLDEIWELDLELGHAIVEGAVIPAQITLDGQRQLWLFSTFGTDESEFLWEYVEMGRESVLVPGSHPSVAYFEASLAEGADPYDPRAIAAFHPAVGYTQTVAGLLKTAGKVSRATWLRAFCNIRTGTDEPLFSIEHVAALNEQPADRPRLRDVAVSYALGDNGTHGLVMASWLDVDGRPVSRVLHSAPGSVWMHDFIVDLVRTWRPAVVGAEEGGPARRITDKLKLTLGADALTTIAGRDYATACMAWLDTIETNTLKHDGSRAIEGGLQHLVLKNYGDGLKVFDRTASTGSIAGPEAAALGAWLSDHTERVPDGYEIRI